jgi:hypothetical protein
MLICARREVGEREAISIERHDRCILNNLCSDDGLEIQKLGRSSGSQSYLTTRVPMSWTEVLGGGGGGRWSDQSYGYRSLDYLVVYGSAPPWRRSQSLARYP